MAVPERVTESIEAGAGVAVRAPGRANLIGEHTDYNQGFVLPIAIDLATYVVGSRSDDIRLVSENEPGPVTVPVAAPALPAEGWGRYVAGVVLSLADAGIALAGLDGTVASDVPIGAGLSSSAALEVGVARALVAQPVPAPQLAEVCRRAENHYVGVQSGIMDQLTSAAARDGNACLIDCRTNSIEYVAFPAELAVLIVDSGIRRDLTTSAYNIRVEECAAAAAALGVPSLRDATWSDLDGDLDDTLRRRARHVITENERVLATADAFRSGDVALIGGIFAESHRSYSEDFAASTSGLDELVAAASAVDEVVGARLTGGGWGGCTINLIPHDVSAESIAAAIGGTRWWVTGAAPGAEALV